ncbi:AbrB/MazE/SpoVT family DNA-binding domain-containing protein [Jiella sonneratiae]|uniref:AbrB/MazE/SpoVT family DNA-binding domain-containing protein n=1 Tax=Jiella sonneratiae TaxID=2816856 RepID=A0ABS3J6X0_9HYPH|nr:AbrB/MazE/SpoVT family DNA-binding domain-containing protein [Jiella sonneratiae]MBO0905414.1 AbrB/MazE/SpoVT family DNA-binding domain-containing protein [Jiella sonneratiae]
MTSVTRVSEEGQIFLPSEVSTTQGWDSGTELEVVERGGEVVLRPRSFRRTVFPPITLEQFLAAVPKYDGPLVTDEMMEAGLAEEAKRRWRDKCG